MSARVAVIGAGMTGVACTSALRAAGVEVDLFDRGRAPGGRMASPRLDGRRVDIGAGYLTARDPEFVALVERWRARGLVRPWTDTFAVLSPDGRSSASGVLRYGAADGLRSLVRDLLPGEPVLGRLVTRVDELDHDAVVLAMPDAQAARLVPDAAAWVGSEPTITLVTGWSARMWDFPAAFVNDDPDVTLLADDGSRRGDDAPVLVAHSTPDRARRHLSEFGNAVAPMVAAVRRLLDVEETPEWTFAQRWAFAKPAGTHGDEPFGLLEHDGRPLGVANDSWCPQGAPRIESGWLSGTRLGRALAQRLS